MPSALRQEGKYAQINTDIPEKLKREAYAALKERGESFTPWLKARLQELVQEQRYIREQIQKPLQFTQNMGK